MTTTTAVLADGMAAAFGDVLPEAVPLALLGAALWLGAHPAELRRAVTRCRALLADLDPQRWPTGSSGTPVLPERYGVERVDCDRVTAAGPCRGSRWQGERCDRCGR